MHIDQQAYRDLYLQILEHEGDGLFDRVLQPWLRANEGERRWLAEVAARRGDPVPPMAAEERWRLYALSRIVDLLQLSFAPRAEDAQWDIARVSADEFADFMSELGTTSIDRDGFHPFFHEVVTVDEAADENAPSRLADIYWPGYMLGPLLISRAGCRVVAGRERMRKEVAERSTLYWAWARNHRPAADPGMGWGSNSQWRTEFRRDYALDGSLHYNVGAAAPPPFEMDEDLTAVERLELLRHRCFVTSPKRSDDRWPYSLTHVEPA